MEKENYIITDKEMEQNGVGSAPDYIKADPADIKGIFDKLPKLIAGKLNSFVDAVAAKFLNYYTKDETVQKITDQMIANEIGDMAAAEYDTDFNGIVDFADNGIFEYVQSGSALVGAGVNGKFKATATGTYTAFTIGGVSYAVKAGEETEIELTSGVWYSFILDTGARTINFKAGGGVSNSKLAVTTATVADVLRGKTFYSGDKTLKTGAAVGGYIVDLEKFGQQSGPQTVSDSITVVPGTYDVKVYGYVSSYSENIGLKVTLSGAAGKTITCSGSNKGALSMSDGSPLNNTIYKGSSTITVTSAGSLTIKADFTLHGYANIGGGCRVVLYRTA